MKAKKFCIIAFVLAIVLLIAPISESWAEEEPEVKTSGDYEYYILDDGTACINRYNGKDEKVIVPEKIDGIRITGIGDRTFSFCENLTEITIPDSVENIGDNPFMGCKNLLNINISANHPTLEFVDNALIYKSEKRLVCYLSASEESKYEISKEIKVIGDSAFSECENLKEITIPDSVVYIGIYAFLKCENLKEISIPEGLRLIGKSTFYGCKNLTKINIPESVKFIDNSAFYLCENLTEINIPDGVQSIGDRAFIFCDKLTEVNVPDGTQAIGYRAFYACKNLTKINIPVSVKYIGEEAFDMCFMLTATVEKDSFAEEYCKENNVKYIYEDSWDWLKN
ncbi:MAG: leucine-rich repeat domain-containing protein [Eubacteriales bacterium]|nr:leucine-rich repeat domain-containing protein [Eubacteriales bacterium]